MNDPRELPEWHQREPDPTEADRAAWHRLQRLALFTAGILLGIAIMAALEIVK